MSATTPLTHGSRPPYRPALDGLRAVAVIGVLIFHLNPRWLPGGWFGVDLFFVLSGFLITTLIVREQNQTGRVNFPAFWKARMRRLLPALVTMLLAVVAAGWFLTLEARRVSVSYDVLAALAYVANWRFIFGDEGYFAVLALPSPVRHTWSLSIEEQFYVFFPLLMGFLGFLTTKRILHAVVLGVLATASAALMFTMFTPGVDPVRVYFGTDTRAFELLIGAIGAIVLRKQSFNGFAARTRLVHVLAWLGLFLVIFAMLTLPEDSPLPYGGGLVILCFASLAAILGAASSPDTLFSKVFAFQPIRWIGLISYPLYLWHWPVIVFMNASLTGLEGIYLAAVQAGVAFVLAWATYLFIEGPIRGRRSLIPRAPMMSKIIVLGAIPALLCATALFSQSQQPFHKAEPVAGAAEVEPLDVTASRIYSALIFGNSIPESLARSVQSDAHPFMQLYSNSYIGCEPFDGIRMNKGKEMVPTESCLKRRRAWPQHVSDSKPDILVYFVSQGFVNDIKVGGRVYEFGTREHDRYIADSLEQTRTTSLQAGAGAFAISNLACHNMPTFENPEIERINDIDMVKHINGIAQEWAAKHDVLVVDTFDALCPDETYSETLNGVKLYSDGLHFTNESGPIFWNWMAPQLIAHLEKQE